MEREEEEMNARRRRSKKPLRGLRLTAPNNII